MSRFAAETAGDAVAIAVAIWFLLAPDFEGIAGGRVLDAVAIFVIGLSAWRILRRWRAR